MLSINKESLLAGTIMPSEDTHVRASTILRKNSVGTKAE